MPAPGREPAHILHAEDPASDQVPAVQKSVQAVERPVYAEYVPAVHKKHAFIPASGWNFPASQLAQLVLPSVAAYLPAGHSLVQGVLSPVCAE